MAPVWSLAQTGATLAILWLTAAEKNLNAFV
jgi:hypothetical protein